MVLRRGFGRKTRNGILGSAAAPPSYPNPPDGYDIMLLIGDSLADGLNATGSYTSYTRTAADVDATGVYQFTGPDAALAGFTSGVISSDITPLWNNRGTVDAATDRISIGEQLGRSYKLANPINIKNSNRRVLIVNMARSGSSISNGATGTATGQWAVGETLFNQAITQVNAAIAAAKAAYPGSRFVGTLVSLGSNDANSGATLDQTNFTNLMNALVDGLRAQITGGSESWVTLWSIVPGLGGTDAATVRASYDAVLAAKTNTYKVIPTDNGVDNLHPTPAGLRQGGTDTVTATASAPEPTKVASFTIPAQTGVTASTAIDSAPVMVTGIGWGKDATLTVSGGLTSVNGGAFSSASKTVRWGDTFQVRVTSSATAGAQVSATATVTGPADSQNAAFSVTTIQLGTTNTLLRSSALPSFMLTNDKVLPATGGVLQEAV